MNTLPHMGELVKKRILEKKLSFAEVCRRINVKQPVMNGYFFSPTLQTSIIWKISIAIEHNLFADLIEKLPSNVQNANHTAFQQTIQRQEEEIKDLKKEIVIYKEILKNK
ncbi:hypothetical protein WFZ85_00675 [Flavobacterium sp. j3]|uniref:HTH cro/C1-type domain-containing protein n=1 Tax=Flavobacterium aureirubrum TaxID=3133147 RepID=A0ABU9N0H7_9FLAO